MRTLNSLSAIIALLGGMFIFGCYSKDFKEPGIAKQSKQRTSTIYRANYQKTWQAVIDAAGDLPITNSRKESGIVTTDWIKGKSDRLYSGYGENRIPYTIRYKFLIKVKPTSKGTLVSVRNKEQYYADTISSGIDFSGSVYQWLDTESSTHKENDFLKKVQDKLFPRK